MPDSLAELEARRTHILRQMFGRGDFRPGSITAVVRRCGKPSCHCAQPLDAGHDPQLRLTRKVGGKTVAETFASPAAFRKAQREVAEFHRFQKLRAAWIATNEEVCRLRPAPEERGGWSAEEKKRLLRSIRRSRGK